MKDQLKRIYVNLEITKVNKEALLKLKTDVEESKIKLSEIKGEEKLLMKQLKENWNCATLEAAKKLLEEMKKEVEESKKIIEEATKELEEKYEFD